MDQEAERFSDAVHDTKLLALHEAGHAVVATHLKRRVLRVVAKGFGNSFTETDRRLPSMDMLHAELTLLFAGYYAVLKETNWESVSIQQSSGDWQHVDGLFQALSIADAQQMAYIKPAKAESKQIIESRWPAVNKVWVALNEREKINGDELNKLISEAERSTS
jgi:ATP-dependent Zn protease